MQNDISSLASTRLLDHIASKWLALISLNGLINQALNLSTCSFKKHRYNLAFKEGFRIFEQQWISDMQC